MSCEAPVRIPNPRYNSEQSYEFWTRYFKEVYGIYRLPDRFLDVPCGKCYSCKRSRLNGWRLRLLYEFYRYPNSVFVTLTFDEYYLGRFSSNYNKAIRLWLDRCRKRFGKQLRHFIIGEYGETTRRFHYHGILFNTGKVDYDEMRALWKYGHIFLGYCKLDTVHYVCKYLTKDAPPGSPPPPRIIASQGIGELFVERYKNEPLKHDYKPYLTSQKGYRIALPRYLKDKLFDLDERVLMQLMQSVQPFERIVDGVKYTDELSYRDALSRYSKKLIGLGLSSEEKVKNYKKSKLSPITNDSIRPANILDPYDFNTKTELARIDSYFGLDETPF